MGGATYFVAVRVKGQYAMFDTRPSYVLLTTKKPIYHPKGDSLY